MATCVKLIWWSDTILPTEAAFPVLGPEPGLGTRTGLQLDHSRAVFISHQYNNTSSFCDSYQQQRCILGSPSQCWLHLHSFTKWFSMTLWTLSVFMPEISWNTLPDISNSLELWRNIPQPLFSCMLHDSKPNLMWRTVPSLLPDWDGSWSSWNANNNRF